MVHCVKCGAENPPTGKACEKCGADLLPGEGIADRLGYLIGGILAGAVALGLAYVFGTLLVDAPECCPSSPAVWLAVAVVSPITGLVAALRRTPMYARYAKRARRHIELDPEQAVADFTQALAAAPEKEQAGLLKERAKLYEKLGMEEEATRDQLDYISAPGAYEGGASLARMLGADKDTYAEGVAKRDREELLASGRAKAVGYCPKCKAVVELSPKLRCPTHGSSKGRAARLVVPSEVEVAKAKVLEEYEQERRKVRKGRIIAAVVVGIPLLLCLATGLLSTLLPSDATPTASPTPADTPPTESPTSQPQATTQATPSPTPLPAGCLPGATFVMDVTIPDGTVLAPGEGFTKVWRISSSGCAPWPAGTRWVFVSEERMGGPESVDVPQTSLGETADIAVELQAPDAAGTYRGYWQLQAPDGTRFGDQVYVLIEVR